MTTLPISWTRSFLRNYLLLSDYLSN